jgi:hypothetical protein
VAGGIVDTASGTPGGVWDRGLSRSTCVSRSGG